MALLCQMIELMNIFRLPSAVQNMNRHVPEFHACKCHGRGMRTRMKPMNERIENAG